MSASIGTTVTDIFKAYTLTGNQYIDGLIFASLIPAVVTYINGLFSFFTKLGSYIISWISGYIMDHIRSRFIGKILCSISITEENRVFGVIKGQVFKLGVLPDVSSYIMARLANVKNEGDKEPEYKYSRWSDHDKFDITLDYSGEKLFLMSKNYSSIDIDMKAFQYKEYYVRFTLKYDSIKDTIDKNNSKSGNKVTIELITMKNISKPKNEYEYANILEDFLKTKFKINDYITYHYAIYTRNQNLYQIARKFIEKGNADSSALLNYGDFKFELLREESKPKILPNKLLANLTVQHIDMTNRGSFNEIINLTSNYSESAIICKGSLQSVYEQFIGKLKGGNITSYGYFINDNKIVFVICEGNNTVSFEIISAGKILLENDIKDTISFIIKNGNTVTKVKEENMNKKQMHVYKYSSCNGWMRYPLDKRSFSSIFLKNDTMTQIRKEIENFMRVEQLYRSCDIPYRKGILFYGPPGTGKTSLAKTIAYEYQLDMYIINVNDKDVNDDTISYMINSIGGSGNKILLFEDIDSAFAEKEKVKFEEKIEKTRIVDEKDNAQITHNTDRKYLTYAGLLNALDGVLSSHHGVITIMTTNYIEKLGEALIRPGRIDHRYLLGPCDYEQICKMTQYIITKSLDLIQTNQLETLTTDIKKYDDEYLEKNIGNFAKYLINDNKESKIKPCQLQQYILKYIENPDNIFENYEELLKN